MPIRDNTGQKSWISGVFVVATVRSVTRHKSEPDSIVLAYLDPSLDGFVRVGGFWAVPGFSIPEDCLNETQNTEQESS